MYDHYHFICEPRGRCPESVQNYYEQEKCTLGHGYSSQLSGCSHPLESSQVETLDY